MSKDSVPVAHQNTSNLAHRASKQSSSNIDKSRLNPIQKWQAQIIPPTVCVHCVLSNEGLNPRRCSAEQLLMFCNGWNWGYVLILILTCHIEDYGIGRGINHAGSDSDLIYLRAPVIPQVGESSHLRSFVKCVSWGFSACVALQGYSQLESSYKEKKQESTL